MFAPPSTDAGTVPNLRFSFADAHTRQEPGGWAREVTRRELPVATALAGVNMRLEPGAIRELHWHKQAEWAYMLEGRARITAIDAGGLACTGDAGTGEGWHFPAGIPHSIQGLADGCEFLLVFDDGGFSENATFLLSDWLAHTPREVVAKNLGAADAELEDLPEGERYIFPAEVPGGDGEPSPHPYGHRLGTVEPIRTAGGVVRILDSRTFPVATTIAAALLEIEPGAMRELHWHPNADEWQYYIGGRGRMTVFAATGAARTFECAAGDVGYVPFAMGHYIQNSGDEPLRMLEMFRSDRFADISLNQWLARTPAGLVREHLHLPGHTIAALPQEDRPIVTWPPNEYCAPGRPRLCRVGSAWQMRNARWPHRRRGNAVLMASSMLRSTRVDRIAVLAVDRELSEGLEAPRKARAEMLSAARVIRRSTGSWSAMQDAEAGCDGLGLLVLDGVLVRRVGMFGRFGAELLGDGDLLQPAEHDGAGATLPFEATWRVLSPLRLAVLDLAWMARMSPYPEVTAEIMRRMMRRSRRLASLQAIAQHHRLEERLWLFFWELADRFGRVGPDGVRLEVHLTHELISHLVGAQRPSVSAALGRLADSGHVRREAQTWLLAGQAPALDELLPD
jgi:oxalate decarboxylase